ncbi:MAG: EAL domain-containing protein [Methylophilaceae bacterium]
MQFNSLKQRITFVFLTLILVIQFIGFIAIRHSIGTNARASINEQLQVGEQIFHNLLNQNAESLSLSARILASDYGFRQAVSSKDIETINSALANHQSRINANIAMFFNNDGEQVASAGEDAMNEDNSKIAQLLMNARSQGDANEIVVLNNRPYQLVVVPVKAPIVIGWVVMGFVIDNNLAMRLRNLTLLDVSFLIKDKDDVWRSETSTLAKSALLDLTQSMPRSLPSNSMNTEIEVSESTYGSRIVNIFAHGDQSMVAVLQRSISEATEPYRALQFKLLILTILGAIVFVIGSLITSKRITQPLTELAKSAEKLEQGDYSTVVEVKRKDEIGNLGRALNRMREAIAIREQHITKLAYWDELTDLPNRASFIQSIAQAIAEGANSNRPLSVLVMDLNRFKQINNVIGHKAGDQLLKKIAERLKANMHATHYLVARFGGDEFSILLPNTSAEAALETAKSILQLLEKPIEVNDQSIDLSAGIGVASYPEHADSAELLLSRAEMAMYATKSSGAGALIYDSNHDVSSQQSLTFASEIKLAVDTNQLALYLQPKIDLGTGHVIGAEALIRWNHPKKGLIYPDNFIPFAEQSGNINKISMWMLAEVARFSGEWQHEHHLPAPVIAINLSARDLVDHLLPNKIQEMLTINKLSNHAISLEITESSIMDDPKRALNTLNVLSEMGLKLSIDDFGTGYSSLSYLKNLPVNELKIDKSFVLNMENDKADVNIIRSTVDLGHNLGLKVVAEGIENQNVWTALEGLGCDFGQGYFISKPMPADQFTKWLESWTATNKKSKDLYKKMK